MVTQRYEMRLDEERRRKLDYLADKRGSAASDTMRHLIDQAYEDEMREYRLALVRHIAEANIEDVPDPEELSRQLDATYDIPDPYRREHTGVRGRSRAPTKGTGERRPRAGSS